MKSWIIKERLKYLKRILKKQGKTGGRTKMATKKDFQKMANIISEIQDKATREVLIRKTTNWFKEENALFNKEMYEKACQPKRW